MTARPAADQGVGRIALVSVRFSQPREFVAELQARGPSPEPIVRLTLRTRRGRSERGYPLPFQAVSLHASYLRQTGGIVHLVTLDYELGSWWGNPERDAETKQRIDQNLEQARAAIAAAGLEVAAGRYAPPGVG